MSSQQTAARRSRVRDRVIELVEQLPEPMLDEAMKVLQALSVKADDSKSRSRLMIHRLIFQDNAIVSRRLGAFIAVNKQHSQ